MKKLTTLIITILALLTFTACGVNYTKTSDSHDVTTTTNQTDGNTSSDNNSSDTTSPLEVPRFNSNSQGRMVVKCEDDIVYYIMAYDCLKPDTRPTVTVDDGELVVDEEYMHVGEVFYTSGHVERTGPVTVTGHVFSGGEDLPVNNDWIKTCQ